MAKGKRFDSFADVIKQALLEKFAWIHYNKAIDRFIRNENNGLQ